MKIAAVFILAMVVVISGCTNIQADQPANITGKIMAELMKNPEIKPFENATMKMKTIGDKELEMLRSQYPVIYNGTKPGDYDIVFDTGDNSLIVLYNIESNKIINMFAVKNIILR